MHSSQTFPQLFQTALIHSEGGNGSAPRAPADALFLSPALSLGMAARIILAFHFDRLTRQEAGTRRGDDPEALHDMRVASRRLQAALRDFRSTFPAKTLAPLEDDIQWLTQMLGRLRDVDVFIEWLETYAHGKRGTTKTIIHHIIDERMQTRQREQQALIEALHSQRYAKFKRAFVEFVNTQAPHQAKEDESLIALAADKIEKELRRVKRRGTRANLAHLKRLHRLRIEAKRLRYTGEFFQSLFPAFPAKLIQRASALQDALGVVHDNDVHRDFLKQRRCREAPDSAAYAAVSEMMRALRREQRNQYADARKIYRRLTSKKFQRRVARALASEK
jgi:CHAD domain-containing protein